MSLVDNGEIEKLLQQFQNNRVAACVNELRSKYRDF